MVHRVEFLKQKKAQCTKIGLERRYQKDRTHVMCVLMSFLPLIHRIRDRYLILRKQKYIEKHKVRMVKKITKTWNIFSNKFFPLLKSRIQQQIKLSLTAAACHDGLSQRAQNKLQLFFNDYISRYLLKRKIITLIQLTIKQQKAYRNFQKRRLQVYEKMQKLFTEEKNIMVKSLNGLGKKKKTKGSRVLVVELSDIT